MTRQSTGLRVALSVEWLKLRRSPVAWSAGVAILVLVPLVSIGGYVLARAGGQDPSTLKARAMVRGQGWEGVWSLGGQVIPVTLLLGTGILASWVFGREFTDGTVGGLFATTVPRSRIATAKVLLVTLWAAAITGLAVAAVLLGGMSIGLPLTSGLPVAGRYSVVGVLVALSVLPVAWISSRFRGYLPGIAGTLAIVVLTQFAVVLGCGAWVPWAAPALWAGAAGPAEAAGVTWLHLALPALIGLGSTVAVSRWWRGAELGNASG